MEKNRVRQKIILVFLILFFCLLFLLNFLVNALQEGNLNINTTGDIQVSTEQEKVITVEDVIEKYDSKYISKGVDFVKVVLSKDLFDENGESNQKFVESLMNELIQFYVPSDFYLIDEEKEIELYARYNKEDDGYKFIINKVENFYDEVDGDAYAKVDTTKIVKGTNMATNNYILDKLTLYDCYLAKVEENLGEGTELPNGYIMYQNGDIKVRTVPTGAVKNIIFSDNYEKKLTSKLTAQMSLKEVAEAEPEYDFGSIDDGYLGYRQPFYYLFFYNDEVSIYTYSYKKNTTFEEILEEYLKTKDLNQFVKSLSKKWMAYDSLEYDEQRKNAKILYSTRGVDINIVDNDPKGITFYSNYYLTDYVKSLIKTGVVSFKPDVDLVEKTEIERKAND